MGSLIARFIKDDEGQDLIEYALIGGLVALGAATTLGAFEDGISAFFTRVTNRLAAITLN
jgi:Flp pilus assembly pilin Flp